MLVQLQRQLLQVRLNELVVDGRRAPLSERRRHLVSTHSHEENDSVTSLIESCKLRTGSIGLSRIWAAVSWTLSDNSVVGFETEDSGDHEPQDYKVMAAHTASRKYKVLSYKSAALKRNTFWDTDVCKVYKRRTPQIG